VNTKKVLCLGNSSEDTDARARSIAQEQNIIYHGLITEVKNTTPGCYQTSFYDMSYGDLIELSKNMDEIIILDQSKSSYNDEHAFYQTIGLGKHLKSTCNVTFLDESFNHTIEDVLKTNKSLCILPFIQSVTINGNLHVCCYEGANPISKFDPLIDHSSDVNRNLIKQKMLAGEKLDRYCQVCYTFENKGVTSPRIVQTVEWTNRLGIKNVDDLAAITEPIYYEIRASNQCNIMCRTCRPCWSSLIEKENQKLKIFDVDKYNYQYTGFEHINIDTIEKLYVAGGEPTIMPEFYKFLEACIEKKKTNFDIQVNTNAVTLNKRFKSLLEHFDNFSFEISVDGYGLVNQYIRWPTRWEKLISNIDYIHDRGHKISFNSVVSIYNITSLYSTVKFLSDRYKKTIIHLSSVFFDSEIISPYIFPNKELVIAELDKIKTLEVYHNDLVLKSKIDEYLDYFSNKHTNDLSTLSSFFEYNDMLDESRNSKLIDYIPELEQCRELIK
jgi:pyruvate-formate lyase-activating enzyme